MFEWYVPVFHQTLDKPVCAYIKDFKGLGGGGGGAMQPLCAVQAVSEWEFVLYLTPAVLSSC